MTAKKARPARADHSARRATSAARVRRYREKQRAAGLRLIQIWIPDIRNPKVAAQIRRECLMLRNDPQERRILEEIEAVADFSGWK